MIVRILDGELVTLVFPLRYSHHYRLVQQEWVSSQVEGEEAVLDQLKMFAFLVDSLNTFWGLYKGDNFMNKKL